MILKQILPILFIFTTLNLVASETDSLSNELTEEEYLIDIDHFYDSVEQTLSYEHGTVTIKNGLAKIEVPAGFKYLNGKDSEMILTDIWGNPPSDIADQSLGMILPENSTPFQDSSYVINITYSEEGYVNDDDAKDINFDELLETMQTSCIESNPYREEQGYDAVYLINWAAKPFYDSENKKLHWAKELKFGETEEHTLNYNIRILGRKGFLELNAIGEMYVLEEVQKNASNIISSIDFNDGNKYADFNPDYDKVAAYGIGALIAGKAIVKIGLIAKLGLMAAKFWKIIALAIAGFFAGMKKFFKKDD